MEEVTCASASHMPSNEGYFEKKIIERKEKCKIVQLLKPKRLIALL